MAKVEREIARPVQLSLCQLSGMRTRLGRSAQRIPTEQCDQCGCDVGF
jgi:hypothetical protein